MASVAENAFKRLRSNIAVLDIDGGYFYEGLVVLDELLKKNYLKLSVIVLFKFKLKAYRHLLEIMVSSGISM